MVENIRRIRRESCFSSGSFTGSRIVPKHCGPEYERAMITRYRGPRECSKLLLASLLVLCPACLPGQGFGKIKKTVVLERKLPAAVKLPGNAFDVKASAEKPQDPCEKLAADKLQSMVETSLIRFNSQLELNPDKPDTLIVLKVLICNAVATPEHNTLPGGKKKEQPRGMKVNGHLQVTYQARTRGGKFVDAEPIDVKYQPRVQPGDRRDFGNQEDPRQDPSPGRQTQERRGRRRAAHHGGHRRDPGGPRGAACGGPPGEYQRARRNPCWRAARSIKTTATPTPANGPSSSRNWKPCRHFPTWTTTLTACITSE